MTASSGAVGDARKRDPQAVEGVGTGAGRGGDPAPTEATPWVNGSADCPEAPAQAHPLGPWTHHDPAVRALIAEAVQAERERIAAAIETARDRLHPALSEGDGNLPRGYTNAARIARDGGR